MKAEQIEQATFAGGCFWCMVKPFDEIPGILKVVSGYSGGHTVDPSYEEVRTGETGHYEVIQITFDPSLFSYEKLLEFYWPQTDPTDDGGQFFDRGPQYRPAIFYHNERQKMAADHSKHELEESGRFKKPIVTQILPAQTFYPAEAEHQQFYKKNPDLYAQERQVSGRDDFINDLWK